MPANNIRFMNLRPERFRTIGQVFSTHRHEFDSPDVNNISYFNNYITLIHCNQGNFADLNVMQIIET